jgi:hypothetical protein
LIIVRQCWRFFLTLVATLAFAETSSAADLPGAPVNPPAVAPSFDWSCLYLGIEGGGGNGSSKKASVAARARVNLGLMVRLAAVPSDIISNGAASSQVLKAIFHGAALPAKRVA